MKDWKLKYSLAAGLVAALCWTAADMLLVGFVTRPDAYPLFSEILTHRLDADLAVLMLDGSPERLFWGVYLATFSVAFYVLAVPGIRCLMSPGWLANAAAFFLLFGYATSPVGHAAFAYLGLQAQSMVQAGTNISDAQIMAFNQFKHLLEMHWLVSVCASAIGWLLLLVQTLPGRTALPRASAILNPLLLAPLIAGGCSLFPGSLIAVLPGCASLNIAQLAFFAGALVLARCEKRHPLSAG